MYPVQFGLDCCYVYCYGVCLAVIYISKYALPGSHWYLLWEELAIFATSQYLRRKRITSSALVIFTRETLHPLCVGYIRRKRITPSALVILTTETFHLLFVGYIYDRNAYLLCVGYIYDGNASPPLRWLYQRRKRFTSSALVILTTETLHLLCVGYIQCAIQHIRWF